MPFSIHIPFMSIHISIHSCDIQSLGRLCVVRNDGTSINVCDGMKRVDMRSLTNGENRIVQVKVPKYVLSRHVLGLFTCQLHLMQMFFAAGWNRGWCHRLSFCAVNLILENASPLNVYQYLINVLLCFHPLGVKNSASTFVQQPIQGEHAQLLLP